MREIADINSLKINILPVALGPGAGFVDFSDGPTKGYIGKGIHANVNPSTAPQIDLNTLKKFVDPTHIYIDAFMNEAGILAIILPSFKSLVAVIVEFDTGISDDTLDLLKEHRFKLVETTSSQNYLYKKV